MMPRRRMHQWVFAAAGIYNLAWGGYTAIDPQWLFRISGMPPLNHPQVMGCLGMVIGVYGLLYLEVARRPERGWPIAAVGLLGKILGPIGMAYAIMTGAWPAAALIICATNDFIWWIPIAMYLRDAWPMYRVSSKHSPSA